MSAEPTPEAMTTEIDAELEEPFWQHVRLVCDCYLQPQRKDEGGVAHLSRIVKAYGEKRAREARIAALTATGCRHLCYEWQKRFKRAADHWCAACEVCATKQELWCRVCRLLAEAQNPKEKTK